MNIITIIMALNANCKAMPIIRIWHKCKLQLKHQMP